MEDSDYSFQQVVPIIDISPFLEVDSEDCDSIDEKQRNVAIQWDEAMINYGCAIIIGHGIEETKFTNLKGDCDKFFNRKDHEYKMQYNFGKYGNPRGGYTPPGLESVAKSMSTTGSEETNNEEKADPLENFVYNTQPNSFIGKDPSLDGNPIPAADALYSLLDKILKVINRISCVALGLSKMSYFDKFYDLDGESSFRYFKLAHYLPQESLEKPNNFNKTSLYGAHTDYQGFTILKPDKQDWHEVEIEKSISDDTLHTIRGGLEIYLRSSGKYVPVKVDKSVNALVINAGDLIQRWTSDLWHSPIHRVVPPVQLFQKQVSDQAYPIYKRLSHQNYERWAFVYFTGPFDDCMIQSIKGISPISNSTAELVEYEPIRSGDHLQLKLNRTN